MQFTDLSLDPAILRAISELKFTNLTEVQAEAIPQLLNSNDAHLFAQAKTGTGKTVAYSIPIAQKINPNLRKVQAVVLVPTRELCNQVNTVITNLIKYQNLTAVEIYGGVSYNPQIKKIKNGAQIIIATPGRFIDLYEQGKLKLDHIKYLVLDEADRMLDFGFMPAIEHIFNVAMQKVRPRVYFFSATLKNQIYTLAERFVQQDPAIKIDVSHDTIAVQSCHQYYYVVQDQASKFDSFVKIFNQEQPGRSIIFVNKKSTAIKLTKAIRKTLDLKLHPDYISGDLTQKQRETTILAFRENKIDCLVATDVAARGLDFTNISHVFNYDIPCFEEDYVHRIGRTSRMERSGTAVSLCLADQKPFLTKIEKFIKQNVEEKTLPGIKIEFRPEHSRRRSRKRLSDLEKGSKKSSHSAEDHRSERDLKANLSKRGFKFKSPNTNNKKAPSDHGFYTAIVERKKKLESEENREISFHSRNQSLDQYEKLDSIQSPPRSIRKSDNNMHYKKKSDVRPKSKKSTIKEIPQISVKKDQKENGGKHKSPSKIRRFPL
jgi:superfamily II DNA/RNA helicase